MHRMGRVKTIVVFLHLLLTHLFIVIDPKELNFLWVKVFKN